MSATAISFILFAVLTAGASITLLFIRNLIHAGFLLFAILFGVAGMFVFAQAEFLAMSQVVLYVGGILVILLFGIMLTQKTKDFSPRTGITNGIAGSVLALLLFGVLSLLSLEAQLPDAVGSNQDDVKGIGMATLTDYLLPFELVSILLLSVLIGAAYLTRRSSSHEKGGES